MTSSSLLVVLTLIICAAFVVGRSRSLQLAHRIGGVRHLDSLPFYYGTLTALWCGLPCLIIFSLWLMFDDNIIRALILAKLPPDHASVAGIETSLLINSLENIAAGTPIANADDPVLRQAADRLIYLRKINQWSITGVVVASALIFMLIGWLRVSPQFKARVSVEKAFKYSLLACSCVAIFTTAGIVLSVLFESIQFFRVVPITEFLFGLEWSPQTAIRADQVGGSGSFGAIPLFTGTLLISFIAMLVAVPAGLMSAIYLSEYANKKVRAVVKPLLEVLAGIPTVVYGFFAALTVAPAIRDWVGPLVGQWGWGVSSESALAAGVVMGVMIIPFISSLSDDVINAVPQTMRDGSLGLGATRSETIKNVVIPAALPGIVGGILLAVSRAIGETMIVVMAAGLAANLTANPLEAVTTVTVQIATLLVGDQEFDSAKTLSAFALGLMLFIVTLCLNYTALAVVKRYREQYE